MREGEAERGERERQRGERRREGEAERGERAGEAKKGEIVKVIPNTL